MMNSDPNNYGLTAFAPSWYYRNHLNDDDQKKTMDMLGDFIEDDNNFHNPDNWLGNVGTSLNHPNNEGGPWRKWFPILEPIFRDFFDNIPLKKGYEPVFQECWANKYSKGYFQEYHNHAASHCNLSAVYYYKLDEEHTQNFRFYNNNHSAYRASGLDEAVSLPSFEVYKPKLSEGDIIIFPAHYPHLVAPNTSDGLRITIAMNLLVTKRRVQQPTSYKTTPNLKSA